MDMTLSNIDWTATAAWMQAIGSIIGIGIAIWVPYHMDHKSRARLLEVERKKQRHTQISLLPTLYELRSKTIDFLEQQSGMPSFLGVNREPSDFDSDFFSLTPKFIDILRIAPETGDIEKLLAKLSILLFQVKDNLEQNSKLQRDGYHTAWINYKDLFIESAQSIEELVGIIIRHIETGEI